MLKIIFSFSIGILVTTYGIDDEVINDISRIEKLYVIIILYNLYIIKFISTFKIKYITWKK